MTYQAEFDNMLNGASGLICYMHRRNRYPLGVAMGGVIVFGSKDELQELVEKEMSK